MIDGIGPSRAPALGVPCAQTGRPLGARPARTDAQLAGRPLQRIEGDSASAYAKVQAQFTANKTAYESALAQERSALANAAHELTAATEVRSKLKQNLPYYREQESVSQDNVIGVAYDLGQPGVAAAALREAGAVRARHDAALRGNSGQLSNNRHRTENSCVM